MIRGGGLSSPLHQPIGNPVANSETGCGSRRWRIEDVEGRFALDEDEVIRQAAIAGHGLSADTRTATLKVRRRDVGNEFSGRGGV